ncbi:MAG: helix-turn-helix domain-containing protein [Pseudomonadota bacterium]|jgi:hypothetical protein|nr:helix-turn-helix domain-containing protein [Pseudomonadota bacterium]|tara:strand:- start:791 stop:1618 length:828 start_codon:yes stop_codon:yes gene_type:complete
MLSDCKICQPHRDSAAWPAKDNIHSIEKHAGWLGRDNRVSAYRGRTGRPVDIELSKSPQLRVIAVYTYVVHNGPVGLSDVARGLCLPISSVFRALTKLEKCGWVRRGQTDLLFQVTSAFQSMVSKACFLDDRWSAVDAKIYKHIEALGGSYRLAAFDSRQNFVPLGGSWDHTHSEKEAIFFSPLGAAAMSSVGKGQFAAYMNANSRDLMIAPIENFAVFKSWMQRHMSGAFYIDDNLAIVPLSLDDATHGAVQVYRGTLRDFKRFVEQLYRCIAR